MVLKRKKHNTIKWLCLTLFILYVSGVSLFTHSHVINNTKYIHSHPFIMGNSDHDHDHSEGELLLLDQIFNTTITANIIPDITPTGENPICIIIYPFINQSHYIVGPIDRIRLRAPPLAV